MIIKRNRHRLNCYRSEYRASLKRGVQHFVCSVDRLDPEVPPDILALLAANELAQLLARIRAERHAQAMQSIADAEHAIATLRAWFGDMTDDERLAAIRRLADALASP